jgi:predicted phosphodiesterase
MSFQLQYISDLHLEHHDKQNQGYLIPSMFLKPSAPYLALCGDIGNPDLAAYDAFLGWCSRSYKLVFLIAGNHEFYNYRSPMKSDMSARKEKICSLTAKYKNIYFLDCSSYYISDYNLRVLGCTLWSDTSSGDEAKIITYMNDARNILLDKETPLVPRRMTTLHQEEKAWLKAQLELAKESKEDVLVLTHYLPSFQLIAEKYKDNPLNMCFASDCEDLFQDPVKAWICGHSHTGVKTKIQGVVCLMNPYGYPGEKVETRSTVAVLDFGTKDNVMSV